MILIIILKALAWITVVFGIASAIKKLDRYKPVIPYWETIAVIWAVVSLLYLK